MNTYGIPMRVATDGAAHISALFKPFIAAGIVLAAGTLSLALSAEPPPAAPAVTQAPKEWQICFYGWKHFRAYIRPEGEAQETIDAAACVGGNPYGILRFSLQSGRLYYLRFTPLDYVFAQLGDRMLKMQEAAHHWPGPENPILLALPVPPVPFCVANHATMTIKREVHSLAEFNAAKDTVWFLNKDEKSDSKLYLKATEECAILLKDPALKPVLTILKPLAGETLSGPVNVTASLTDGASAQWVAFSVDGSITYPGGSIVGSDSALRTYPPYTIELDTTKLSNGPHEIEATTMRDVVKSKKVAFMVDNTRPTVFLINGKYSHNNPAIPNSPGFNWSGRQISGTVPVEAGVANLTAGKVEFYMDSTLKETDSSNPYAASMDTTTLKDGSHEITVKAYDAAGKLAASRTEQVLVINTPPVTITAPVADKTVSGTVVAMASVLKDIPYRWLMFKIDGVYQGEDNLIRHEPPLGLCIDTTKLSDGPHVIEAQQGIAPTAAEAAPDSLFSDKVSFKVDNTRAAVFLLHKARFESPWPGRKISGTVPVAAGVANMKAVSKVEFYVDATLKETDSSGPYGASIDTTTLEEGAHELTVKAYDGAGNLAASQTTKVVVANAVKGGAK